MSRSIALAALLPLVFCSLLPARGESAPYVPGRLLVKFRPGADGAARAAVATELGATTLRRFTLIDAECMKLGAGVSVEQAVERLRGRPGVEYAEPDYELRVEGAPNDEWFPYLWSLDNTGQTGGTPGADIHAVQAWDVFTGDPHLKIGVIDTGIDYTHHDLVANVWTNPGEIPDNGLDDDGNGYVDDVHGYDFANGDGDPFDDHSHGTMVAGIIAGKGDNLIGVPGVCWQAQLVAIKVITYNGYGTIDAAIAGLEYAVTLGIKLTNNSYVAQSYSQALLDAINAARAAGCLFVAAAGNGGSNNDQDPRYPASYNSANIIAVTSSDNVDGVALGANYGPTSVDLAAPGVDIISTFPDSMYRTMSGTSMATAYVTGVCALAMGQHPELTAPEIKGRVLAAVDVEPYLTRKVLTNGRLNAFTATVADVGPETISGIALGRAFPNPFVERTRIAFDLPHPGHATIEVFAANGRRVAVLADRVLGAGPQSVEWDGLDAGRRPCASGVYWARLGFEGRRASRRLVLMR